MPPITTPIVPTELSDWNRRIHPPIGASSATASQARCLDTTCSADFSTNTIDELHERIYAPYGSAETPQYPPHTVRTASSQALTEFAHPTGLATHHQPGPQA